MPNEWNRSGSQLLCYTLATNHPIFQFPTGLGPFPTAAEAGKAMDMLLVRYPDLRIRLDRLANSSELMSLPDETLDERLVTSQWWIERLLMAPFSIVETIESSPNEVTAEHARQIAARVDCSPSDIVLFQGTATAGLQEPLWIVFRLHLQTEDAAKAKTKALWLRREREQKDLDTAGVIATTLPLYYPASEPV
ncbi:hypothetical protein [Ectopseudomonas guguanensis]|uniref:hypothetical protein n=1 Tax=Ectopseudomonas guguanensis TaxID=1198456 RepID=UPI002861FB96|nr:hypothetical protein [Pseudomonas guguanensis]MDR8016473.1 hypothetical protein [Pseudomonas guguanensis]